MAAEWSFRSEGEFVVATEKWYLDDPELPFIVPNWHPRRDAILRDLAGAEYLATDYPFSEEELVWRFGTDRLPKS